MSARRSTRERKKPRAIYEVEDRRGDAEEAEGAEQEQEDEEEEEEEGGEEGEEEDEEEEEADRSKAPPKKRARLSKQPKVTKQKVVRPRKLKPVPEEGLRPRKKKQPSGGVGGDDNAEDDGEEDENALFEAIKRGKCSIPDLVTEWRERYEEDADQATREVLNFVLQACGGLGQCVPPTESLEKLDMGDLVDYVVDDLEKSNEGYPIASRSKAYKKFHQNFADFWESFIRECYECELLFTTDIVDHFVDWLTSLSSAEVRAIRHTTTVAAYAVGSGIVGCVAKLAQQLSVIQRQLNAESTAKKTSKPTRKGEASKKLEHLKESKLMYEERQSRLLDLVQLLFNGVVVHRYRDVMPEVRVESVQVLGNWIHTLPDHFLKDNYLKYLGWVLNDKESQVRLGVVDILRQLYENEQFAEKMELFTSRFLPRFLELCNDVDDMVVEACIKLLIAVDKRSLISSDVELHSVERLVFDENNKVIRKAAAEFVCLQYDAFGVAESKRSAKLTREQLNTQAIALVEFAEEYVTNHNVPAEAVETMVDAFWGLDDCQVLQDWKLLTSLLLADKNAPDLTSDQQTLLIRLLVASIGRIAMGDNDKSGISTKNKLHKERDEMCVTFCKEIPNMLVRFQADVEKLALLVELIPLLALKGEVNGLQAVHVKSLLEKLEHAYTTNTEVGLLKSLALSIHHLRRSEHELIKRESDITVHQMVQDILDKVDESLEEDEKLFFELERQESSESGKGKRRASKKKDFSDSEYAVRTALTRLNCLITHVCVRDFLPQSSLQSAPSPGNKRKRVRDSTSGDCLPSTRMESVVQALVHFVSRRTKKVTELDTGLLEVETIKLAINVMLVDLLWLAQPVFASISRSDPDGDIWTQLESQVDEICASRSLFEEAVISVLEMHLNKVKKQRDEEPTEEDALEEPHIEMEELVFEDPRLHLYVKEAQRAAFMAFCDARCLFVEQFKEAPSPVDRLDWPLPKVLVLLTQMYFENEMESTTDLSEPDEEAAGALEATKAAVLLALGRVSHTNPSNKRQAAAVLRFLVDGGAESQEIVRAFSRQIKAEAPVRYLEVQMTALRQIFSTILSMKEEWQNCEDDESTREEIEGNILTSEAELKELGKKLSQSLGIGKVALSLRAPFFRFLCEGVRYSLEQPSQFSFLEALRPYLTHLDKASTKQLNSYFSQLLDNLGDDVPADAGSADEEWRLVFEFQSLISDPDGVVKTGSTVSKMLKRKARASVGSVRATEEKDEEAPIAGTGNGNDKEDEDNSSSINEAQISQKRLRVAKRGDAGVNASATLSAESSTAAARQGKSKRKLPLSDAEDTPQKRSMPSRTPTRRSSGRITQLSDDEDGEEVPVEEDVDVDTEEAQPEEVEEEEEIVSRRGRRRSRARK